MDSATKVCTKCGECKPLSMFYPKKRGGLGVDSGCKSCRLESKNRWARENPEKRTASRVKWNAANKNKVLVTRRAWAAANPDKIKVKNLAWRELNPEKKKAIALRAITNLADDYVAQKLRMPVSQCSSELISLKREQLMFHRAYKQLNAAIKEVQK